MTDSRIYIKNLFKCEEYPSLRDVFLGTMLIGAVLALLLAVPAMATRTTVSTSGFVELNNSRLSHLQWLYIIIKIINL